MDIDPLSVGLGLHPLSAVIILNLGYMPIVYSDPRKHEDINFRPIV